MFSGIVRHISVVMSALAVAGAALTLSGNIAAADPDQDQKFFELLGQKDIPPVDGENDLVNTAHKVCSKLDGGMAVGDMVELIRNNGFNDNPLTRLQNPARVTRTIDRFITASVEAYCPHNRGKIAAISGYRPDAAARIELVSFIAPKPAGDIAPTKPLPVPAQPAPQVPQEIQPAPQEAPPPPPRHVPPPPKQAPPPPEQPPPPAEAPDAPPPEAAPGSGGNAPAPESPGGGGNAPAPAAPGGGTGGGNTPAPPTPEQPSPPGHIRLAP